MISSALNAPGYVATATRKVLTLAAASVVFLIGFAPAAQATTSSHTISITHYEQNMSNWCWATASQVIIKYHKGTAASQCTLVHNAKGGDYCDNVQGTLYDSYILLATYMQHPGSTHEGYLPRATATNEIAANRPIISFISWTSGGAHMVTIYGFSTNVEGPTDSNTFVSYSNADGAVGTGTNATRATKTIAAFHSNTSFTNTRNLWGAYA